MVRYKPTTEVHLDQQPRLFELSDHTDRKHPNHVCIVTWTDGALSILAQAPVNHETKKRVLFLDHLEGRVPDHEALGLARHIAKRFYEDTGSEALGPTMTL